MIGGKCRIDGIPAPCSRTNPAVNSGTAAECKDKHCGRRHGYNPATKQYEWRVFRAFAAARREKFKNWGQACDCAIVPTLTVWQKRWTRNSGAATRLLERTL